MRWCYPFMFAVLLQLLEYNNLLFAANFIPANHPHIQYVGRWDMSDSLHPKHSWPGVSICAEFIGKSIGVRMADDGHFYNVYIDGKFHSVLHGTQAGEADYTIADSLKDGPHTLLLTKRNCAQNKIYSFSGFLLDDGAELLAPPSKPARKIEFIGDSFTVAEGNEATELNMPWEKTFPVSDIDKSFATIIARHFNAEYHTTARSGIGMVTDWSGDHTLNMPDRFERALMDAAEPKWNFQQWVPNLVVICLGLNDHSGLKDKEGKVSSENSALYRKRYHDFLATIRSVYPGVTILAVAAHVGWIRENVQQVVNEERAKGKQDIHYAQFDYFQNGYVANGHPSVATHEKIANQLLEAIEAIQVFGKRRNDSKNKLIVHADSGKNTISRHIYGQFSEHLGRGIYEGIWVGENSPIPNTRGIRNDVIAALKKISVPNLRWPGGCFADEYHWRDGVGPRAQRPTMINTHWGGVIEDNSFGTHEFFDLCEQLNTEPYLCGNVGSGTVEEMSKWVEYITFDGKSPMADLRRKNGRDKPWKIKYWGVGNENWGCGGNMTADYYADLYKRSATYCRDYGDNHLFKIAGGAGGGDFNWTEVLMKKVNRSLMSGLSLHHYFVDGTWQKKKSAIQFDESEYFALIEKCLALEALLAGHAKIMNQYDPENHIGLMVDEWGAWHEAEPGSTPGFLYQQNTLRDALVAALSLNLFHQHCDRVKMANIAQTVNVLQAMILTDKEKMILTPTYHVFDLYKVHQDALFLPAELQTEDYEHGGQRIRALHASSSKAQDGSINISIVNVHPDKNILLECELRGIKATRVSGKMLTAQKLNSHNTFDQPDNVKIVDFKSASLQNNVLKVEIPAKSVVVLNVK